MWCKHCYEWRFMDRQSRASEAHSGRASQAAWAAWLESRAPLTVFTSAPASRCCEERVGRWRTRTDCAPIRWQPSWKPLLLAMSPLYVGAQHCCVCGGAGVSKPTVLWEVPQQCGYGQYMTVSVKDCVTGVCMWLFNVLLLVTKVSCRTGCPGMPVAASCIPCSPCLLMA
jgi:hypothetical protein